MPRIVIIGNAGGGKSTLARTLAVRRDVPLIEIDSLLWRPGWTMVPLDTVLARHAELLDEPSWLIEGLGPRESVPARLARATEIILVDMPLWMHFWLAAERQVAWTAGTLTDPPAGLTRPPPTEALFRTMWEVDQEWMPALRAACAAAEHRGTPVLRLSSVAALAAFTQTLG